MKDHVTGIDFTPDEWLNPPWTYEQAARFMREADYATLRAQRRHVGGQGGGGVVSIGGDGAHGLAIVRERVPMCWQGRFADGGVVSPPRARGRTTPDGRPDDDPAASGTAGVWP
jgi:hypothetical protein